jgi:hypothetical protein
MKNVHLQLCLLACKLTQQTGYMIQNAEFRAGSTHINKLMHPSPLKKQYFIAAPRYLEMYSDEMYSELISSLSINHGLH